MVKAGYMFGNTAEKVAVALQSKGIYKGDQTRVNVGEALPKVQGRG